MVHLAVLLFQPRQLKT